MKVKKTKTVYSSGYVRASGKDGSQIFPTCHIITLADNHGDAEKIIKKYIKDNDLLEENFPIIAARVAGQYTKTIMDIANGKTDGVNTTEFGGIMSNVADRYNNISNVAVIIDGERVIELGLQFWQGKR